MTGIQVTLITGRSLRQGIGKEIGKLSEKYKEGVAICEMDGKDFEQLGIKPGSNVRISTKTGSVILKSALSMQPLCPGAIFIPYGPYANALIGTNTEGTGMPSFKGIKAEVEPALGEEVLDVKQLLLAQFKRVEKP